MGFARCGTERVYPWGNDWPPPYGNFGNQEVFPQDWKLQGYTDDYPVTCPVEKSGVNEWGLYGVAGNAWEWTTEDKGGKRAVRGGAWTSCFKELLVCEPKGSPYADTTDHYDNIGFRVILAKRK
jgi:formylglycine-generating enzyme required for sulfatase activity